MRGMPLTAIAVALAWPVQAHHSYAMFDGSRLLTVDGTVARMEWRNPHVVLWVYVRSATAGSGHDLYAFENGSMGMLERLGWNRQSFTEGERVTVAYWPLKDGRTGGHLKSVTRADGELLRGAGGPRTPPPGGR